MGDLGTDLGTDLGVGDSVATAFASAVPVRQRATLDLADPLGTDISSLPDLDFTVQSGHTIVAEALVRRLQTPRGGLFYAPDYGTDVRDLLLSRVTEQSLFAWKSAIEQECLRDERVENVTAELTFDYGSGALQVEIEATTGEGPFSMTLVATRDEVSLSKIG